MKKLLALYICINFFCINSALAFEDELADLLDKNLHIKDYVPVYYEDETAKLLNQNLKIKSVEYNKITNDTVPKLGNGNYKRGSKDDKFDFENLNRITIKLTPEKYFTTRKHNGEGSYINFKVVEDVKYNNIIIKKGTRARGRVETISMNGLYGVPANLLVDNFTVGENGMKVEGQISKIGANRALWVKPAEYLLLPVFFIGPIIFVAVRGGHAKLKPGEIYEVYIEDKNAL